MMARVLLALTFALALALPAAADVDIIPEALTLKYFKALSWDPQTGLLHGSIAGEPAGTGELTVQIVAGTKVSKARLGKFPLSPNRALAEVWNSVAAGSRQFGTVSTSPFSVGLSAAVRQQGYLRIRLGSDLASVTKVRPEWPKEAIDVCQVPDVKACCFIQFVPGNYEVIETVGYAAHASEYVDLCVQAGGLGDAIGCKDYLESLIPGFGALFPTGDLASLQYNQKNTFYQVRKPCSDLAGGATGLCFFQVEDLDPFKCTWNTACAMNPQITYNFCKDNGGEPWYPTYTPP